MRRNARLFDTGNYCAWCNNPIPVDAESDLCEICEENRQFRLVREYVRENDVNEYQLAEQFSIPLRQVKDWIREGRLEYKEEELRIKNIYCADCGKQIQFGTLCPECNRKMHGVQQGFESYKVRNADEQIRFKKNSSKSLGK